MKVPSLTEICLRHDLGYAYGDPGNESERKEVDSKFKNELLSAGASEFAAKAMYDAVRVGGKEELCLSFTWGFAREAPCKPGSGLKSTD
jgi:predicted HD phosphohydrolase